MSLYDKHRGAGLEVLMISDEPAETLVRFAAEEKIAFPVLSDPQREVHKQYGVGSIPFTLVIDREGKVATGMAGYSAAKFEDELAPAAAQVLKQ